MRDYLIALRRKKMLSQAQAAERGMMGQSNYNAIEHSDRQKDMSVATMEKLAAAFDIPVAEIFAMEMAHKNADKKAAQ
ncbi:MAG: helix-turn-helix transcriptional regulator [Oscillospiraceae bacterium]